MGRAVDPDPSGGFHQPVRLRMSDGGVLTAIGAARLSCGISGAAPEQSVDFVKRYRHNENPAIAALAIVRSGSSPLIAPDAPGTDAGATVARGETVTLRAAWDACPTAPACGDGVCGAEEDVTGCEADCKTPKGCAGSEQYVWFDPEARVVSLRREAINIWTAPDAAGEARIWLVVRGDRGGVGWQSYRVRVE